jgi:hypothetical protein
MLNLFRWIRRPAGDDSRRRTGQSPDPPVHRHLLAPHPPDHPRLSQQSPRLAVRHRRRHGHRHATRPALCSHALRGQKWLPRPDCVRRSR